MWPSSSLRTSVNLVHMEAIRVRTARTNNLSSAFLQMAMTMNTFKKSLTSEQYSSYKDKLNHLQHLMAHTQSDSPLFAYPTAPAAMLAALPAAPVTAAEIKSQPELPIPLAVNEFAPPLATEAATTVRTAVDPSPIAATPITPSADEARDDESDDGDTDETKTATPNAEASTSSTDADDEDQDDSAS